jgi:hypothetical protein
MVDGMVEIGATEPDFSFTNIGEYGHFKQYSRSFAVGITISQNL